ncbi:transposase protein A [Streptococcus pneumoniae]|nr:transposase protein A [Streptococcus pneumoniae]
MNDEASKQLTDEDTVMIDATEVQINRPKKRISELFW